jgi:hypothetical protein
MNGSKPANATNGASEQLPKLLPHHFCFCFLENLKMTNEPLNHPLYAHLLERDICSWRDRLPAIVRKLASDDDGDRAHAMHWLERMACLADEADTPDDWNNEMNDCDEASALLNLRLADDEALAFLK